MKNVIKYCEQILILMMIASVNGCVLHKSDLPVFNLQLPDSVTIFNTANIPTGKPTVLIYYSSDCKHCQDETADIVKNIGSFRDVNLYFLTNEPYAQLKIFYQYYKLSRFQNITVGRDYEYYYPKNIVGLTTPHVSIYNRYKQLRAVFSGEAKRGQIIKAVADIKNEKSII